ncbi:MAG: 3-methyl-2-oxobutanoate hydroxymethyltransferase [Eggerthellaceae bacterium]|jgi:3-methyl-2-oxobutanoate hydroxymethyltransferase
MAKNTVLTIKQQKRDGDKITMVTSYDFSMAKLAEQAGINMILVGDSLGMTMLGYEDTISVTMEDMIHHCASVARATENTLVVCDMPFMSYETSVEDGLRNAARLMKEGRANAVKLEGGARVAAQIKAMTENGIPVQGHIGLTPQSSNVFGGFKVQGKSVDAAKRIVEDALKVQEAGAFSMVLEGIPAKLGTFISQQLDIPTIGIGAGNGCDGQVLVCQDLLDMFGGGFVPKFVKQYAHVGDIIKEAYGTYIEEVKSGVFPGPEHSYSIDDEVMDELIEQVKRG